MFGKIAKFAAAAAILGGGMYASDTLYWRLVHQNMPAGFVNFFSMNAFRSNAYRYGVGAAGAIILVPLVTGMLGLAAKSPIKAEASPVK